MISQFKSPLGREGEMDYLTFEMISLATPSPYLSIVVQPHESKQHHLIIDQKGFHLFICVRASLGVLNELKEMGYEARNSSEMWRNKEIARLK